MFDNIKTLKKGNTDWYFVIAVIAMMLVIGIVLWSFGPYLVEFNKLFSMNIILSLHQEITQLK